MAGRPTLVQNVETLADLALIGRYGAEWFRSAGTSDDPGNDARDAFGRRAVTGRLRDPARLATRRRAAHGGRGLCRSAAVCSSAVTSARGSHPRRAADVRLGVAELKRLGGGLGAGIVFAMPREGICALAEVARAHGRLADQNAGQCGPCVNGLDAIAGRDGDARQPATATGRAEKWLMRWLSMMEGRGACKHPDGVARFVAEQSARVR